MMVCAERLSSWIRFGLVAVLAAGLASLALPARAADPVEIRIAFLSRQPPPPPAYEIDPTPEDEGLAGGQLGIRDNNTTGTFTGQHYTLVEAWLGEGEDAVARAKALADGGASFIAANLPADELLAVADALKDRDIVFFNAGASDDRLRGADCRANVLPRRAEPRDAHRRPGAVPRLQALAQASSSSSARSPADKLYAEAMRRAAKKFGLTISAEKPWEFGPLARAKADSPTTADALVFTRGVDYDVAVVADERRRFRRLPHLPHLGPAPRRRHAGARRDDLASDA